MARKSTPAPALFTDGNVPTTIIVAGHTYVLVAAATSAPVVAAPAGAPVDAVDPAIASRIANGKRCTCGHEHERPVATEYRARLATERACVIKGCVTGCAK